MISGDRCENEHSHCLLCGELNPQSFGLQFMRKTDGSICATFQTHDEHQGYDGIIHGGVIASLLDSVMTHCLFSQKIKAVTADLNVRYIHSVPIGSLVEVSASLIGSHPPLYRLQSELCVDGKIMAKAYAKFVSKVRAG